MQTRTRTRGHKLEPVSLPYRVFARGHADNLYSLPSIFSTSSNPLMVWSWVEGVDGKLLV